MASSAPAAWASSVAAARRSSTLAQPWRELDPGGLGERRRHGRARPRRPGGARPWRGHGGSSTPAAMGELNPGRQQLPASRLAAATAMGELDPGLEERDGLEDAYLGSQWCATQNRSPVLHTLLEDVFSTQNTVHHVFMGLSHHLPTLLETDSSFPQAAAAAWRRSPPLVGAIPLDPPFSSFSCSWVRDSTQTRRRLLHYQTLSGPAGFGGGLPAKKARSGRTPPSSPCSVSVSCLSACS